MQPPNLWWWWWCCCWEWWWLSSYLLSTYFLSALGTVTAYITELWKSCFPLPMESFGRSNWTKLTACKWSLAGDPDILTPEVYSEDTYSTCSWPGVKAREKIGQSPVGCCTLQKGQMCQNQSQSRDQESCGTRKMELAPGKINTNTLHCHETPERPRSTLGFYQVWDGVLRQVYYILK